MRDLSRIACGRARYRTRVSELTTLDLERPPTVILTTVAPSEYTSSDPHAATVEVKYSGALRDIDGEQIRDLTLSRVAPVRISKAYPGRKNYSGVYWARTTGRHHWFESLYEKTALTAIDRNPSIVDIATQPFKLAWLREHRSHFPDILAKRADGSMIVVDVRPREQIKDRDREVFAMTCAWATSLGMDYRLFADLTKVQDWNLRLLAGYRYARWACPPGIAESLAVRKGEVRTLAGWLSLFEGTETPAKGLLLAAIWHGALEVDLSMRLEFAADASCMGRGWE